MIDMRKMKPFLCPSVIGAVIIALALLHVQAWGAVAEISWDANTDPELSGYRVHYGTASGSYQYVINASTATTIEIDGLKPGQTYYFAVTACFNDYETEYSHEVSVSIPDNAVRDQSGGSGGGGGCFMQTATLS